MFHVKIIKKKARLSSKSSHVGLFSELLGGNEHLYLETGVNVSPDGSKSQHLLSYL